MQLKCLLYRCKLRNIQMAFVVDPAACEPNRNIDDVQLAGLKLYLGVVHVCMCGAVRVLKIHYGLLAC
jgi:hypothetical protein